MRPHILEAREFLIANQSILDEMNLYDEKRNQGADEIIDDEKNTINQYHRLKTFILEKKMGLLQKREKDQGH